MPNRISSITDPCSSDVSAAASTTIMATDSADSAPASRTASSQPPGAIFELGITTPCKREPDAQPISCEIIERELHDGVWRYYVHYEGTDRRLDEWVSEAQLVGDAENADGGGNEAPASLSRTGSGPNRVGSGVVASAGGHPAAAAVGRVRSAPERRATRNMKRRIDEIHHVQGQSYDEALEREHEESTKVKNIKVIEMGQYEVDTWYFSPYPDAFGTQTRLFICPYSLKYFKRRESYLRHLTAVTRRGPPGLRIYGAPAPAQPDANAKLGLRQPARLTLYEVDGSAAKVYCQCLCLLAKLFLDHKTLYYDVDPFLFYVLCEEDENGAESLAGYFSKEKSSAEGNNIACILVLPQHQRKGYGKLLIDLAYHITMREGKVGSPEKPLSDLGQLSFRSYWTEVLLDALRSHRGNLSIKDLAVRTAIHSDDIIATLQSLNLIRFWKGQHVISVSPKIVDEHLRTNRRQSLRCEPTLLTWQPSATCVL